MEVQIIDAWNRACRAYEMARLEHERVLLAMRHAYTESARPEEYEDIARTEETAFARVQAALSVMRYFARACAESLPSLPH